MSREFSSASALADQIIETVGKEIVLGLPVGLGKAVHVANALFARAKADPSIRLTIFTALTLETPQASSELEARFLDPIARRLFDGWPSLSYVEAIRRCDLPSNIHIREFYFRPAAFLGNPIAQRTHTSINYSQVVDELLELGVNVIAQIVSARPERPGHVSLSCNPEVTLDLMPHFAELKRQGKSVAAVAQVNRHLPYMTGDAEVPVTSFDFVLDSVDCEFPLFGIPNRSVGPADYATGMHVASLIPDGGTIQLGIGSLSDAVAHCLWLRQEAPELFADVLARLPGGSASGRRSVLPLETGRFRQGLYASSELMSDALFSLFERGILCRQADEEDETIIHGGFFVGSSGFYEALRGLDEEKRSRINMTRISYVNTLFGDEQRKRRQRRGARFINETMMATLLGAAVSDALEDGRVVSGVGGQFDFVSMAHALHDGLSILMLRARRLDKGRPQSNIRWSYGHATVPRHHRDVFVSEYGIAATRGQPDHCVIEAMLNIADSAFQDSLLREARRHGKIADDHCIPADATANTPEALREVFGDPAIAQHFPPYPLGTELTIVEQQLAEALTRLKEGMASTRDRYRRIIAALLRHPSGDHSACLERLGLEAPASLRERLMRRLVIDSLEETMR